MKILGNVIGFLAQRKIYGLVLIIVGSILFYNIISIILEKIIISGKTKFEIKKRKTILDLLKNLFKYFVFIICILLILDLYGHNVKALVAGLGIVATVLGLALQDTLKDFISGITILMENYYVSGDIVKYKDFTGEVIEFTLKSTKVKSLSGEVLTFANRNVTEIINLSQKEATIIFEIPVAYETKVDKIEKIINESILPSLNSIKDAVLDSGQYLGINQLADSSITYMISLNCKQESQWQVKRDLLKIVLTELNKNKIKIPYQQLEVHNAKD